MSKKKQSRIAEIAYEIESKMSDKGFQVDVYFNEHTGQFAYFLSGIQVSSPELVKAYDISFAETLTKFAINY